MYFFHPGSTGNLIFFFFAGGGGGGGIFYIFFYNFINLFILLYFFGVGWDLKPKQYTRLSNEVNYKNATTYKIQSMWYNQHFEIYMLITF